MDEFSNVSNALLGIHRANKVVGVKPLPKRDDRRRRDDRPGQGDGTASGEEGLIYHRSDGPLVFEPVEGSNESTTDPVQGETGPKDKSAGPRKVNVVV
jgi:hypothetical protein